jgi:hypothetical protein
MTQDTSMDTGFFKIGLGPSAQEGDSTFLNQSLLGKLIFIVLHFYFFLSLVEREALNSSNGFFPRQLC